MDLLKLIDETKANIDTWKSVDKADGSDDLEIMAVACTLSEVEATIPEIDAVSRTILSRPVYMQPTSVAANMTTGDLWVSWVFPRNHVLYSTAQMMMRIIELRCAAEHLDNFCRMIEEQHATATNEEKGTVRLLLPALARLCNIAK